MPRVGDGERQEGPAEDVARPGGGAGGQRGRPERHPEGSKLDHRIEEADRFPAMAAAAAGEEPTGERQQVSRREHGLAMRAGGAPPEDALRRIDPLDNHPEEAADEGSDDEGGQYAQHLVVEYVRREHIHRYQWLLLWFCYSG